MHTVAMSTKGGAGDEASNIGSADPPEGSTILLVRHGQTEWNVAGRYQGTQDSPLTKDGVQQAVALGERLKRRRSKVDFVCSSDLPRAKKTAEIIAKMIGYPVDEVKVFEGLRERGFGLFEGCTRAEVQERYPEELAQSRKFNLHYKVPGGESRQQVLDRSLPVLDQIAHARQGKGGVAVVVSHGGVVSLVLRELLGIPWGAPTKGELRILNTSICDMERESDGRWSIRSIGDTAHCEVPSAPAPAETVEEAQEEDLGSVPRE